MRFVFSAATFGIIQPMSSWTGHEIWQLLQKAKCI